MMFKRKSVLEHRGVRISNNPKVITPNILTAIKSGRYEHKEANQLQRLIQPGDRILEIGGGIGFLSTLAAKRKEVEAVLVYEAHPGLIEFIRDTYKRNAVTGIEVRNRVLTSGEAESEVAFYLRNDFWASSLLAEPWGYKREVRVPTEDLEETVESFQPSVIVCDIEGGEVSLFDGANLPGVRNVLLELHQRVTGGQGIRRIFDNMSRMNFHYDEHYSAGPVVVFTRLS